MRRNVRIVPDYEVVICPPAESFRWFVHDYPHRLAKWLRHPEYELHLTGEGWGLMMAGDHMGEFEPGCLVLTEPNRRTTGFSAIAPGEVLRGRDVLVQFTQGWADRVTGLCPELGGLRDLFGDAAWGVEFTGAMARAGQGSSPGSARRAGPSG